MSDTQTATQSIPTASMTAKLSLIDFQIINLLAQRSSILSNLQQKDLDGWQVTNLGELNNILMTSQAQFYTQAKELGLKGDFVRRIYRDISHHSLSLVSHRLTNPNITTIKEQTRIQAKKSRKSKKKS